MGTYCVLCRLGDSVAAAAYAAAALPDGPSQPVVRLFCKAAARRCLPVHGIGGGPIDVASSREAQAVETSGSMGGPGRRRRCNCRSDSSLGSSGGRLIPLRISFWKNPGARHLALGLAERTGTILGNGAMRVCGVGVAWCRCTMPCAGGERWRDRGSKLSSLDLEKERRRRRKEKGSQVL